MEWIRVEDGLPKVMGDMPVIVCRGNAGVDTASWYADESTSGFYNHYVDGYIFLEDVTHWMALPPRPKEIKGIPFETFWVQYPVKVAKANCERKWKRMTQKDKKAIMEILPRYLAHKPFAEYRHPNPYTFLNQRRWEDPIPESNANNGMVY